MCRSSAYSWTQDISIAGTISTPSRSPASIASGTPATAVVVGQGQRRHPGLGRLLDHLGRRAAGRRRRSSDSGARS